MALIPGTLSVGLETRLIHVDLSYGSAIKRSVSFTIRLGRAAMVRTAADGPKGGDEEGSGTCRRRARSVAGGASFLDR